MGSSESKDEVQEDTRPNSEAFARANQEYMRKQTSKSEFARNNSSLVGKRMEAEAEAYAKGFSLSRMKFGKDIIDFDAVDNHYRSKLKAAKGPGGCLLEKIQRGEILQTMDWEWTPKDDRILIFDVNSTLHEKHPSELCKCEEPYKDSQGNPNSPCGTRPGPDFRCLDPQGQRGCLPGGSLHMKMSQQLAKEFNKPEEYFHNGGSFNHNNSGEIKVKSFSINGKTYTGEDDKTKVAALPELHIRQFKYKLLKGITNGHQSPIKEPEMQSA